MTMGSVGAPPPSNMTLPDRKVNCELVSDVGRVGGGVTVERPPPLCQAAPLSTNAVNAITIRTKERKDCAIRSSRGRSNAFRAGTRKDRAVGAMVPLFCGFRRMFYGHIGAWPD